MKIGVALSGCDIGGIGAYAALFELERQGLGIGMITACGIPAVTALPYAYGCGPEECRVLAEAFLEDRAKTDLDMAVAELSAKLKPGQMRRRIPLAVGAVNVPDGRAVLFADGKSRFGGCLDILPLEDAYDALSAAISPAGGLASYPYGGFRLCDFSVWYGCPVHPLRLAGIERTVSIAFLPRLPDTPCEVMAKQKIRASAGLADVHITVEPEEGARLERYIELAAGQIRARIKEIYARVLF